MKTLQILGVPSSSGALYSGTELAPNSLRKANLIKNLSELGISTKDLGDIELPSIQVKQNIPPIRNWPAPRQVWDTLYLKTKELFQQETPTLILGGDCSILVGTASAFYDLHKENTHILLLDAHIDNIEPVSTRCLGAAAMGLWILTNENILWHKKIDLDPKQISILGVVDVDSVPNNFSISSLKEIKKNGIEQTVKNYLSSIPEDAKVLLHVDVDVISPNNMFASYGPSNTGLSLEETREILSNLLQDSRVEVIEIAEFSGLKDHEGTEAKKIVDLLTDSICQNKEI